MNKSEFTFELPSELIAHYPAPSRVGSRLLSLDGHNGNLQDHQFPDVLAQLNAGDLLVFNNTKVIAARLFGQKATGGQVEILLERIVDENNVLAQVRASKSPKAGTSITLFDREQT